MRRLLIRGIVAILLYAVLLFVPAGTIAWPMAWAFLVLQTLTIAYALFGIHDEALFRERSRWHADAKVWDKWLMPLAVLPMVCLPVVAGLDMRWSWSPDLPDWLLLAAFVAAALGQGLVLWALKTNTFFSSVVRIQSDRDHRVITGGPYRYVRHPGYSGFLASMMGYALMLGSLWALVPSGFTVLVIVIRTALEDRTLQRELEGYVPYTTVTPYRLLPGIW